MHKQMLILLPSWEQGEGTEENLTFKVSRQLMAGEGGDYLHLHSQPALPSAILTHRIIELLRLEKTHRIIQSKHSPITNGSR